MGDEIVHLKHSYKVLPDHISDYNAVGIAQLAHMENTTLKEMTAKPDYVTAEQFNEWLKTDDMVGKPSQGPRCDAITPLDSRFYPAQAGRERLTFGN